MSLRKLRSKFSKAGKQNANSKGKKVKFPNDLVFEELVKDGDSSEMVAFLRRQSVDIDLDKLNEHGTTALANLISNGNLQCVRVLITLGADVNRKDEFGWTPLHYASTSGSFDVAEYLLDSGANPDIPDHDGLLPVDYTEDFEMIELLTINSPSVKDFSPKDERDEESSGNETSGHECTSHDNV